MVDLRSHPFHLGTQATQRLFSPMNFPRRSAVFPDTVKFCPEYGVKIVAQDLSTLPGEKIAKKRKRKGK